MKEKLKKKVLVLDTGNSCCSQMAEALINDRLSDTWTAFSAGTEPAVRINSLALDVLSEMGIEHVGKPKHINDIQVEEFDLELTLCDNSSKNCSAWIDKGACVQIKIPDPSGAIGTREEILLTYRIILDEIEAHLLNYLDTLEKDSINYRRE